MLSVSTGAGTVRTSTQAPDVGLLATKTTATVVVGTTPTPWSAARSCQRGARTVAALDQPGMANGESDEKPDGVKRLSGRSWVSVMLRTPAACIPAFIADLPQGSALRPRSSRSDYNNQSGRRLAAGGCAARLKDD